MVPKPRVGSLLSAVGERSLRDEGEVVRPAGLQRSDYAGMSNDKTREKRVRRKPKVSWVKLIFPG